MAHVQRDWENREYIQNVQYNIMKIAEFLNKFDTSTRYRLATINEKLTSLERQMDFLEASIANAKQGSDEWTEKVDEASGNVFLVNSKTGETKWK